MGFIYMITSPSGKSYIGQTLRKVDVRWTQHVYTSNHKLNCCPLLGNAIRKYGKTDMNVTTLLEVDNHLLDHYENVFITAYRTMHPYGYNLEKGGKRCSEYTRNKISKNRKGIKHTEETKQKISQSQIGTKRNGEFVDFIKQRNHASKSDTSLPMYVCAVIRKGEQLGYQVCRHPVKGNKAFLSQKYTLEEKLQMAIDFVSQP